MQCGGRRLPEQGMVFDGKASELPETVARRYLRNRCRTGRCLAQGTPYQVHAAQQEVAFWPHSQMLLAAQEQRPR